MIVADEIIKRILDLKGILYTAGNGGSASIADHIAVDFMKAFTPTISLASNGALITMIANDHGYQDVFDYQLVRLMKPEDMVMLISSSGNSPNVCKAAEFAKYLGCTVISLTGFTGGKLKALSDINYHVDSHDYGHVENEHTKFFHLLAKRLREIKC